jgi:hypothetical protein
LTPHYSESTLFNFLLIPCLPTILKERAKNPTTEWEPEIDFDDFLSGLLHWRGITSTSPSSRHLGLYKAVATAYCNSNEEFTNPADSDDPFDIPTQEKADQILHLSHGLAATAATRGFYLQRWIQAINGMIY